MNTGVNINLKIDAKAYFNFFLFSRYRMNAGVTIFKLGASDLTKRLAEFSSIFSNKLNSPPAHVDI